MISDMTVKMRAHHYRAQKLCWGYASLNCIVQETGASLLALGTGIKQLLFTYTSL